MTTQPVMSLEGLLAPLSTEEFFAAHWQQTHAHVSRDDPDYYGGLLSIDQVDAYLALARRNPASRVSVVRVGRPVERLRVAESEPRLVYQAFHSGHSILLEEVDRVWPPLFALARALRRALGADIRINAYLTPPGAQGAHVHPDIHDVFAVQLEGHKQWSLYQERAFEPVAGLKHIKHLGRRGEGSDFAREAVDLTLADSPVLRAGDMLYLPRGLVHKAVATDQPSLHLSVAVEPVAWVELLSAACEVASASSEELSRCLPPDFAATDTAALAEALRAGYRQGLALLDQPGVLEDALEILRREQMRRAGYVGDDHFAQIARVSELSADAWVERRQGLLCMVESSPSQAVIRFGSAEVGGPARLAPAFAFIRDHERFQVQALPGRLDDNSKLVLVRRLICEGLLRRADDADTETAGGA